MKKLFTLFFALVLSIGVRAQVSITEAIDFKTVDHHGQEIHLFDILDGGQYVLIDFFFTSCQPCQNALPSVVDAYYSLGCNQHDVFFMEISPIDHNDAPYYFIDNWIETYGVEYPTIYLTSGGEQSGGDICDMYNPAGYPTMILISPDREILLQDIWPISSGQTIVDALAPFGIEEHECEDAQAPAIVFEVEREASYAIDVKFTPNASTAKYYVLASTSANLSAEEVKAQGTELTEGGLHTFTELSASTEYNIYALPVSAEGDFGTVKVETAKTKCEATAGVAVLELNVAVVPGFVIADAFPNSSTSEYHYAFVKVSKFEEWGEEYAIFQLLRDQHPVCGDDFWQLDIAYFEEGVEYYCYGIGYNAEAELGEPVYVRFKVGEGGDDPEDPEDPEDPDYIAENSSIEFTVNPNPAKSSVNVNLNGDAQVKFFDMTGRCVKEVNVSGNTTVNIEDLNKGIYFVNVNGNVQKLVVE
ncbi:MAG: T9SS type A sorting domain-containing protein [Bacteroidales bacterium]|nr:T9SS type A sorting domain-containing protein [Bacteroidales bacterium]